VRNARERRLVLAVVAPCIRRVEQVLLEARRDLAHLGVNRLEPRLAGVVELRTAQLEVAQLVLDELASRSVQRRERVARAKRAIALVQAEILEISLKNSMTLAGSRCTRCAVPAC
jgi:hypothetical protein